MSPERALLTMACMRPIAEKCDSDLLASDADSLYYTDLRNSQGSSGKEVGFLID